LSSADATSSLIAANVDFWSIFVSSERVKSSLLQSHVCLFCEVTLQANITIWMCSLSLQPDWLISQMGDRCIISLSYWTFFGGDFSLKGHQCELWRMAPGILLLPFLHLHIYMRLFVFMLMLNNPFFLPLPRPISRRLDWAVKF